MNKLISFDLHADMGFFKKPDINDKIFLTYNMLHKPALLGILGAIIGLSGYKEKDIFPEYYNILKELPVGIEPLNHENGNFQKTTIKYNNGVGYASGEDGGNLIINEQTLIKPSYRVYLLLNPEYEYHSKIFTYIREGNAEFLPYLGKNDYSTWWSKNNVMQYDYKIFECSNDFSISSIYYKQNPLKSEKVKPIISFKNRVVFKGFSYFESLPIGFHEGLFQYILADFVFTNWTLSKESSIPSLYSLNNEKIIQLF